MVLRRLKLRGIASRCSRALCRVKLLRFEFCHRFRQSGCRKPRRTSQAPAMPIRRNQRKCEATPARRVSCAAYLNPNSRQASSTNRDTAG